MKLNILIVLSVININIYAAETIKEQAQFTQWMEKIKKIPQPTPEEFETIKKRNRLQKEKHAAELQPLLNPLIEKWHKQQPTPENVKTLKKHNCEQQAAKLYKLVIHAQSQLRPASTAETTIRNRLKKQQLTANPAKPVIYDLLEDLNKPLLQAIIGNNNASKVSPLQKTIEKQNTTNDPFIYPSPFFTFTPKIRAELLNLIIKCTDIKTSRNVNLTENVAVQECYDVLFQYIENKNYNPTTEKQLYKNEIERIKQKDLRHSWFWWLL